MIQRSLRQVGPRRLRNHPTALMLALFCGASALVVAGCGSSSSSSSSSSGGGGSGDAVAVAAAASTTAPGYQMKMAMTISSSALPSPITATGTGAFNVQDRSGSFNLTMNLGNEPQVTQALGSSTLDLQEIIKAPVVYVKLPAALASKIPGGKPWLKVDVSKAASSSGVPGLSSLAGSPGSNDPSQLLQYLRAVSGSISNQGSEQVGGVQTTHYRATISLDKVPDALPAAQRKAARQGIAALESVTHLHALPVDVWVDGHHLVRRMQMTFTSSAQGQNINTAITIEIPEYGPQPSPTLPPSDQVGDAGALLGSTG